jgi:chemotaxis signal transduction protein
MSNDVESLSEAAQEISAFYYTAANHNILLENDIKTEIVDQLTIFPMPHSPAWCHGMISLRGKIIPVLDMAFMLKTEPQSKDRWLLILESSPLPLIAIKIDRLPARISYSESNTKPIDNDQLPKWFLESVETDDMTLFKADHSILFNQLISDNSAQANVQNIETAIQQDTLEDDA